jgi:hypothetical protein
MKSRVRKWGFHRCARQASTPSFGGVRGYLLRVGAVAGVLGASAQFVAGWVETDWDGPPTEAATRVANSSFFTGDRLLDLIGLFLTLLMLAVVASTLRESTTHGWTAVPEPLLAFWGALGAAAILIGATLKDAADSWLQNSSGGRAAYLATFDVTARATEDLFFGTFVALGLYLACLDGAVLSNNRYPRPIGWAMIVISTLLIFGNLLSLVAETAFLLVLVALVGFAGLLVALAVVLWRQAQISVPVSAAVHPL